MVKAIEYLYPNAVQGTDFDVYADDGVQYIPFWKLDDPQPTEEELQVAYDNYLATREPEPPTLEERVTQLEKDVAALKNA